MPVKVTRFIVTTIGGEAYGTVCFKDQNQHFQLAVVELKKGKVVQRYQIPFINEKKGLQVRLADGCARSKYFVAVQKQMIYVIDKTSSNFIAHQNAAPINVVACHPEEEMIATGDVTGRIRLWREIFSKEPIKDELHWHHQIVLSLAFSQSGTILYSGGVECVLVKWDVKNKFIDKDFLPRLPGSIKQISVDAKHDTLTLSLDDNSIQIINSGLAQLKSIQDFTQASLYDLGMADPFPAGIVMNPRHLVMNGRIGHLQFFSTKTMKLLFNIDIAARNSVPRSKKVNIFSTQITRVALSVKWMVTVESWNDRINSPDSRLKFWKFKDDQQTYALHTQIEQAHEKEIHCIEFSTMNDSRAIICATAGLDHCIKIWSLEKSEEVKGAKKIWLCIEQLGYKNLPLKHLSFSQDSSLIAAGFGNCLCVWDTTKFSLKCALSAAATNDGSVNRVMFSLPSKKSGKSTQPTITSALEKRRKIIDLMMSVISGKDSEALVKNITQPKKRQFEQEPMKKENSRNLSKAEKEQIFKRVLSIPDIKFKQKIEILHKLNIYYKISNQVEQEVVDFINRIAIENQDLYRSFHRKLKTIRKDDKFRIQWRFRTWNMLTSKHNRNRITVRKLLTYKIDDELLERKKAKEKANESFVPIKNLAHITNVIFCTEDLSHLVIATTSERLLVWDLLTLKLQGSFKLHIKFVSLDPLTNLVAAFTKYNELFIFNPSPAMTLHSQMNIPEIYGAIWVPRATPKAQTLNVNWQATSQLLFLTKSQEVCCFKLPYDDDYGHGATLTYLSNGFKSHTPFAAMMAQEITDGTTKHAFGETKQIAVIRTGAVKDVSNATDLVIDFFIDEHRTFNSICPKNRRISPLVS